MKSYDYERYFHANGQKLTKEKLKKNIIKNPYNFSVDSLFQKNKYTRIVHNISSKERADFRIGSFNEISGRYVKLDLDFWSPNEWRINDQKNLQSSSFKELSPEEVSFPRTCNNVLRYTDNSNIYKKGTPIHVKGALIYNYFLHKHKLEYKYPVIKDGDKIKFLMLKLPNTFKDQVISFSTRIPHEFNIKRYVDYDLQFEKTFTDPLRFILESIGWQLEKEATLESFFG